MNVDQYRQSFRVLDSINFETFIKIFEYNDYNDYSYCHEMFHVFQTDLQTFIKRLDDNNFNKLYNYIMEQVLDNSIHFITEVKK